jgi:hypothetical protein
MSGLQMSCTKSVIQNLDSAFHVACTLGENNGRTRQAFSGTKLFEVSCFFLRIKGGKPVLVKIISFLHELIQGLTSKAQQGKYLKVIFPVFCIFKFFFLGDIHISRPLAGVNEASDQKL